MIKPGFYLVNENRQAHTSSIEAWAYHSLSFPLRALSDTKTILQVVFANYCHTDSGVEPLKGARYFQLLLFFKVFLISYFSSTVAA